MNEQYIISILFIILIFLFIWGKFRYDAVALIMLALFVILGFIEPQQAFVGLGHPAVITVALVLLISKGLEKSGFISFIGIFGGVANLWLSQSYKFAEVSLVTPLKYLALVFAIIFGYLIWDEIPTIKTLIGATLVIVSSIIIFRREILLKKQISTARHD